MWELAIHMNPLDRSTVLMGDAPAGQGAAGAHEGMLGQGVHECRGH